MMRLMPCGLLCAGLTGVSAPAAAQTAITFRQAMDMVQQRNERWRAADLSVGRAERTRAEMRGLYWPTVGVVGGYSHLNDDLFVDLNDLAPLLSALNPGGSHTPTQRHGAGERPGQGIGGRRLDGVCRRAHPRGEPCGSGRRGGCRRGAAGHAPRAHHRTGGPLLQTPAGGRRAGREAACTGDARSPRPGGAAAPGSRPDRPDGGAPGSSGARRGGP